ncbi:hypothetical protein RchiOBHm_Chr2g0123051 [Rosa chinensis]|uniref:Uncharacterized protein n=1 Tax=Rosa chinensis TaxID=74649 RepID=A0A2P6RSZ1_ROSCH|nr:hypothetical protein RchiOBHm_Chr2g0123051 [Rosa chinensis]
MSWTSFPILQGVEDTGTIVLPNPFVVANKGVPSALRITNPPAIDHSWPDPSKLILTTSRGGGCHTIVEERFEKNPAKRLDFMCGIVLKGSCRCYNCTWAKDGSSEHTVIPGFSYLPT